LMAISMAGSQMHADGWPSARNFWFSNMRSNPVSEIWGHIL